MVNKNVPRQRRRRGAPKWERYVDTYVASLAGSAHTKLNSAIYARAFLHFSDGVMDRIQVLAFMHAIANVTGEGNPLPGKKPVALGSQSTVWGIVKRLFETNGVVWPMRKTEGPRVQRRDQNRIRISYGAIKLAVDAARAGQLSERNTAFLAFATVYGMRKMELALVVGADLDLARQTLYVDPEKHGRGRYHYVPDELLEIVKAYDFSEEPTVGQMSYAWEQIEATMGMDAHVKSVGWHALRRALITNLEDKKPTPVVRRFLRWSVNDSDMAERYNTTQVVGPGQSYFTADEGEIKEDKEIFEVHPFLPLWRGEDSWAAAEGV